MFLFGALPYPHQSKPGVLFSKMDFLVGFNSKRPSKSELLNQKVGFYSRKTPKTKITWGSIQECGCIEADMALCLCLWP